MREPRRRSVAAGGVLAAVLAVAAACVLPGAARAAGQVTLAQTEPGNIFTTPRRPAFGVKTAEDKVTWCAVNYWGKPVPAGDVDVVDGKIELPVKSTGFYRVHVVEQGEPCDPAPKPEHDAAQTTFAVLPAAKRSATDGMVYSVQTHFGQATNAWDPEIIPLITKIGAEGVRDAQPWEEGEQKKGVYDFTELEGYMTELHKFGLDPMIGFSVANKLYDAKPAKPGSSEMVGCTPYTEDGINAYAAYAVEVLRYYEKQGMPIKQVGIYNEPNLPRFGDAGPGAGDGGSPACPADAEPEAHLKIAKAVHGAIEGEFPGVTVAGPELSAGADKFDKEVLPWLEDYVAGGGVNNLDVVSLHPYRPGKFGADGLGPEQLDKVRDQAGEKPIWITELGWQSENVGEEGQAANLPRAYTVAMSRGVPRFNWYNFRDHSSKTFGLIQRQSDDQDNYAPKPSYVAYGVMTAQLAGHDYDHAEDLGDAVQSHVFTGGVRTMWAPKDETTVRFTATGEVTVTDIMGRTKTIDTSDGTGELKLTGDISYVHGDLQIQDKN